MKNREKNTNFISKLIKNISENSFTYSIILIIVFVTLLPLFKKGTPIGDDWGFHLARIEGVKEGLINHIFPVKISYGIANTYTYGSGFFYSNFFMYLPAILKIFLSGEFAIKIFMGLSILALSITTYISAKHITKSKFSSLIYSGLVTTSYYFIINIYYRFAVGEYLAMIFIPLIIAGIWDFVYNDFKKPLYIIVGFTGVIFSHVISVIISIIFCIIFILLNFKKVLKNKNNIIKLVICAILVAMLTISYWLPMLEQFFSQELKTHTNNFSHTYNITMYLNETFGNSFGNAKFSIGNIQSILILINFVLLIKNRKNITSDIKQFYYLSIIFFLIIPCKNFWKFFTILDIIQFPWRLLGIVTLLNSLVFCKLLFEEIKNIKLNEELVIITITAILIFSSLSYLNEKSGILRYVDVPENYYNLPITLGGGKEYLPANSLIDEDVEINFEKLDFPNEALNEQGKKILGKKTAIKFEFENSLNDSTYTIPFFYYKGYSAKLIENNGEETKLDVTLGKQGLVQVTNINKKGKILVWYEGTKLQKFSYIVNIIFVFGVIIKIFIKKKIK